MCIEAFKNFFKRKDKQDLKNVDRSNVSNVQKSVTKEFEQLLQQENDKKDSDTSIHSFAKSNTVPFKSSNSNRNKSVRKTKSQRIIIKDTKPPKLINSYEPSLYIGNDHWKLFSSHFNQAVSEINIITGSVSYSALSLLCVHVQNQVKVRILTGRGRNYDKIFQMSNIGRENIKRCQRLHAKICIIDGKTMIIGSSNITKGSLGDHNGLSGNYEADLITNKKEMVSNAKILFEVLWNEKRDIKLLQNNSGFISSAFGIPLKLKDLVLEAKEEITIIIPPFFQKSFVLKSIPKYIRELNPDIRLKVIMSHKIGENNVEGLEELQQFHNTEVILVKDNLHCKIYMFDGKIAVISSLNFYLRSWIKRLESGIISDDKRILNRIKEWIATLEMNQAHLQIKNSSEGGDEGGIADDFIEKLYFKFKHEGEKLIPELRLDITPELELKKDDNIRNKKKKSRKIKSIISKTIESLKAEISPNVFVEHELNEKERKNLSVGKKEEDVLNKTKESCKIKAINSQKVELEKIDILPEIMGDQEINKKERVDLLVERSKLFLELDSCYRKSKEIKEYINILYSYALKDKSSRERFNSLVKDCKTERQSLSVKKREIKKAISKSKNENEKISQWKKINKIEDQISELWNKQCKLVKEAQEMHEKNVLKFNEINFLKELRKKNGKRIKNIKERINKINLQLAKLKRTEEISEINQKIIIEDLFNYLLVCPYKNKRDIIWYFVDFATDYGIYFNSSLFFDTFHLSFKTKNPIRTAGHIFKVMSIVRKDFETKFKNTVHRFFKNMILSKGRSGLEIKDRKQYERIKRVFAESFGFPAPNSEKILNTIISNRNSLNQIIIDDVYYERVYDIFHDTESTAFIKLINTVEKERKRKSDEIKCSVNSRKLKILTKNVSKAL